MAKKGSILLQRGPLFRSLNSRVEADRLANLGDVSPGTKSKVGTDLLKKWILEWNSQHRGELGLNGLATDAGETSADEADSTAKSDAASAPESHTDVNYDDLTIAQSLADWLETNRVEIEALKEAVSLVSSLDGMSRAEKVLGLYRRLARIGGKTAEPESTEAVPGSA